MAQHNNKPIKVGIVGLGRAGWNIHVRQLRGDERFQITAVCDLEQSRLDEAHREFGCATFTDYKPLLKHADCELIVVASKSVDHGPQAIAAFKSGYHVLVEKPMALSTREAMKMIRASETAGKKLFVHQSYRYLPDVHHIREVIKSGLLGQIFEVRIRILSFSRRNDWQTLKKYGGGNLNNSGAHFIDTALLLLDAPVKRFFADLQLTTDVGDADDHAKIVFKGENGRVIDLEVSTSCAFKESKWTLLGTNGTLRSDGETSEIKYYDPRKVRSLKVIEAPPKDRRYGSGDVLPWQEETRSSVANVPTSFYDNVYDVLRKGKRMEITPEHVLEVIRIIEVAHRESPVL